jgi:hypothetical protein
MWVLWMALALAGTGPWVPGTGVANVYIGLEGDQFNNLATPTDPGRQTIAVGEGISTITGSGTLTYGVAPRLEVELRIPYSASHANREDAAACLDLGLDACDTTHTVGVIEANVKGLLLDEVAGAPLSLALGGIVRYGGLAAPFRARLTNAGEGTTDLGGKLSAGRVGALGGSGGYGSASVDLYYLHRIPNTRSFPLQMGSRRVPGDDVAVTFEAFFSPRGTVAFGPAVSAQHRLSGLNFTEIEFSDPDRLGALRTTLVSGGLKALVRDNRNNVFVVSLWHTLYGVNNPTDQLIVSVGISLNDVLRKRNRTD